MPRKKLIRTNEHPYHVTSRSNNKEWFYISQRDVWIYMCDHLKSGAKKFNVKIYAYVLMSNHYHLLLLTPESNLDEFMQFFNQNLGKSISRHAGRINRIFGAPYKWSLIKSHRYYMNVLRYIYQNPLAANLVSKCEDYPYSNIFKQNRSSPFLDWINTRQSVDNNEVLRKKLRRYIID